MSHPFSIIPLTIEAKGEVISSNIDEFRELVREALGTINRDLQTDEQFGQAELDAKALKDAEENVKYAKEKALADAESLHALFVAMDETSEEIRKARLDLETQIKKRKEEVKTEIINEHLAAFDIEPQLARKYYLKGLQEAIKGKRTVESMQTACRTYQVTQQAMIAKCREILDSFEKAHGPDLIMDRRELELERPEGLEAELRRRFEAKRAAIEKKRLEDEAAAARAEAQAAIRQAEAAKAQPEVPANVTQGAWGETAKAVAAPVMATADEEWEDFKASCIAAFQAIKAKRETLKHSKNIAKATGIANGFNSTWKEWA